MKIKKTGTNQPLPVAFSKLFFLNMPTNKMIKHMIDPINKTDPRSPALTKIL
jgi:hypothetical protein